MTAAFRTNLIFNMQTRRTALIIDFTVRATLKAEEPKPIPHPPAAAANKRR